MSNQIKVDEIYDYNLNFLLGSGASSGLFPTLALSLRSEDGNNLTIEMLAEEFEKKGEEK